MFDLFSKVMEELSNLLKLKEENRLIKEENDLVKAELTIIKERFDDLLLEEKSAQKVFELKMLLEKYKKEKGELKVKLQEAENFANKRNEEILSALVKGSYGITFEDFIIHLSEVSFLKIPIERVLIDVKETIIQKFTKNLEIKQALLDESIQKYERKRKSLDLDKIEFEQFFNQRVAKIREESNSQLEIVKRKLNEENEAYRKQYFREIKKIKEKFNEEYINSLERELHSLKQTEKISIKSLPQDFLNVSINLLKNENARILKENKELQSSNSINEKKLLNCQRELSKYLFASQKKNDSFLEPQSLPENISKGGDSDGSKGWHDVARESGKFGSLPSFDNYDDDYLDNSKEGFE